MVWQEVQLLWEMMWSHGSPHLPLFLALAVLCTLSKEIRSIHMQFDDILRRVNDLAGHISLLDTLVNAEALMATLKVPFAT